MARSPELVIFDCDGVLVDSEMISSRTMAALLTEHGYAIDDQQCRERFTGLSLPSLMRLVEEDWGRSLPADFEERVVERDKVAFAAELRAVPGVAETVARLARPRCVASSGTLDKIRRNLRLTGLLELFEPHLFSARMVARGKPAPDLFLHAAAAMGVAPTHCLVIEDSTAGIEAALAAGMAVFGFNGGGHCGPGHADMLRRAGADIVFDRMETLPELLT